MTRPLVEIVGEIRALAVLLREAEGDEAERADLEARLEAAGNDLRDAVGDLAVAWAGRSSRPTARPCAP